MPRTLSTNVTYGKAGGTKPRYMLEIVSQSTTYRWSELACNSTDVPNWAGNEFTAGRLAENGLGKISQKIDLKKGGSAAKVSGFTFKISNADKYAQDTLFDESGTPEYFENRRVELRLVYKKTYLLYDGLAAANGGPGYFTVGETVTGDGGANATILRVIDLGSGEGVLVLGEITSSPFVNNETITDETGQTASCDGTESVPSWANGVTLFHGFTIDVNWSEGEAVFKCEADWEKKHKNIPTKKITKAEFPGIHSSLEGKYPGIIYGDFSESPGINRMGIGWGDYLFDGKHYAHRDYISGLLIRAYTGYSSGLLVLAEHELSENKDYATYEGFATKEALYLWDDEINGFVLVPIVQQTKNYEGFCGYDFNEFTIHSSEKRIYYMITGVYNKDYSDEDYIIDGDKCCGEYSSGLTLITADNKNLYIDFSSFNPSFKDDMKWLWLILYASGAEHFDFQILARTLPTISGTDITPSGNPSSHNLDLNTWNVNYPDIKGLTEALRLILTANQYGASYTTLYFYRIHLVGYRIIDNYQTIFDKKVLQTVKGMAFKSWIDSTDHSNSEDAGDLIESPAYIAESILADQLGLTTENVGTSLDFDGINDYIKAAHASSLALTTSDITIMGWVYVDDYNDRGGILFKCSDPDTRLAEPFDYYIKINTGKPTFAMGSGAAAIESIATAATGTAAWVHIAVTYKISTTTVTHYKNGATNGTSVPFTPTKADLEGDVYIGRGHGATNRNFNGKIDELRIYNRVLTTAEILADYNSGTGTYGEKGASGLIAGWHMDEGAGRDVRDFSGGGHHAGTEGGISTTMPIWADGIVKTTSQIVESALDTVAALRSYWKFARHITKSISTYKLLRELCAEGHFAYMQHYDGREKLMRITEGSGLSTLSGADFLVSDNGKTTLRVGHTGLKEMRNEFILYYHKNYATGDYDYSLYVTNPDVDVYDSKFTNLSFVGGTYWDLCHAAYENFQQVNRWEYKADWIRDAATAELFLKSKIKELAIRKYFAKHESPMDNIDIELCDQRKLSDDQIPAGVDSTQGFICTGLEIDPKTDKMKLEWTLAPEEI